MKAICTFCKTQFSAARSGAGKCPVCGHRTGAPRPSRTPKLWVAAALFLAACIFAAVSLNVAGRNKKSELLTVSIGGVSVSDSGYVVRANIRNFSDMTYSVPDLVFVIKTSGGIVLNQVVQLPPQGLIEPLSDVEFTRVISPAIAGAGKISVHFAEEGGIK